MARKISAWLLLLFSVALAGCDHATKFAAASSLKGRPIDLVPGVLSLRYAENRDVAFSLFRHATFPAKSAALVGLATLGTVFVAAMWWRRRSQATRFEHLGWSLAFAGALGNTIDRLARGYVIDFIHVRYWPIFNVADIAVVAGVMMLVLAHWQGHQKSWNRLTK